MAAAEYLMTISSNGQVSIPAAARARWNTRKLVVVDLGDRVVMRPAVDANDAPRMMQGKYAGKGPDSGAARRAARRAEDATPRRRG